VPLRLFRPSYRDGDCVDIGGVTVRLRVNPRARRISLRLDLRRGEAVAVAPDVRNLDAAVAFVRSRQPWMAARLAAAPRPAEDYDPSGTLTVLGRPWRLVPDGRRPRLARSEAGDEALHGCGAGEVDPQLVVRAIRREALADFTRRLETHCRSLGVATPTFRLADTRSRWGSCTPPRQGGAGAIRVSWRLALAPLKVADYVVAHECAHLREANHGPRFWALVAELVGDPKAQRSWLRRHGSTLHTRFAAS